MENVVEKGPFDFRRTLMEVIPVIFSCFYPSVVLDDVINNKNELTCLVRVNCGVLNVLIGNSDQ